MFDIFFFSEMNAPTDTKLDSGISVSFDSLCQDDSESTNSIPQNTCLSGSLDNKTQNCGNVWRSDDCASEVAVHFKDHIPLEFQLTDRNETLHLQNRNYMNTPKECTQMKTIVTNKVSSKCMTVTQVSGVNSDLAPDVVIYQRHQKVLAFGKRFHVSIVYKDNDKVSSHVTNLVNDLDSLGFLCYYKCRDFIPGQRYPKTIVQSFEQSMKILIILTEAFLESDKCQYELDLALEECFSRGEDGDRNVIIPCRLEQCKVPRTLKPFQVLDIFGDKDSWWNHLINSIEQSSDYIIKKKSQDETEISELEVVGTKFLTKLRKSKMDEVVYFLAKPVAYDLFHFLNQCNDFRFFFSAMRTLGIEIKDSTVLVSMKTLKDFVSRPYYIAHMFKENMQKQKKKVSKVGLIVYDMEDLMLRKNSDEVKQFNEIVRTALNANETYDHFGRGVVYSIEGIPKSRAIRNECRMLIHDAVVEPPVTKPKYPQFDTYEARLQTFRYYPSSAKPTKEEFADAGYFCADDGVVFRCFYCNAADWDFKPDEEPWVRHAKYYYHCPFVLSTKGQEFVNRCRFDGTIRQSMYNPDFEKLHSRINSYINWDIANSPNPKLLAEAGFYFTHIEDKVACHMCGHGLRNWQKADDPWYKHALWSPNCKFLKNNKTKDYIEAAKKDRKQLYLENDRCLLTYTLRKREVTKIGNGDL